MTVINRTVPIKSAWIGKVFVAGLIAGAVAYVTAFLLYPSDVFFGWLYDLVVPVSICAIPSWIGAVLGRVWLSNFVFSLLLMIVFAWFRTWTGAGIALGVPCLAAAMMSYLAARWELFKAKPRTVGAP